MKKCKYCGAELDDSISFCAVCGKLLDDAPESAEKLDATNLAVEELSETDTSVEPVTTDEVAAESQPFVSDSITESVRAELEESLNKRKKAKRRKTLISVLIALVLAAAITCIIIFTSPRHKLLSAFKNSGEDINAIYATCENLINVDSVANSIFESGQYSAEMDISGTISPIIFGISPYSDSALPSEYEDYQDWDYQSSLSIKFGLNYDLQNKLLDGSCDMIASADVETSSLGVEFSANEEQTMLRLPDLLEDTYCFNNDTLGEDLADSSLYDSLDLYFMSNTRLREVKFEPFAVEKAGERQQQIEEEMLTFLKTVEIKKSNAKICDFSGDVYRLNFEAKDLKLLVKRCLIISNNGNDDILYDHDIRQMLNEIRSAKYKVYAGIENGKLAALSVQVNNGEKISIVLKGTDNIWNDFSVYSDNEEVAYGGICTTDNGMELEAKTTRVNASLLFEIDDKAEELSLTVSAMRTKAEILRMSYSENNGTVNYSIKLQPEAIVVMGLEDITCDISVSPLENTPEMLADTAVDILAMNDNEIETLLNELNEKLMSTELPVDDQ